MDDTSSAWRRAVSDALVDPAMHAAFMAKTGREFVDSAAYIVAFTKWFTITHWGIENTPPAYRKALEARQQ